MSLAIRYVTPFLLILVAAAGLTQTQQAQAQTFRRPQSRAYVAIHADTGGSVRDQNGARDPYAAMSGGFAGSSSARDVARTFGY